MPNFPTFCFFYLYFQLLPLGLFNGADIKEGVRKFADA